MSQDLDKENLDNDIELSKTVSFKPHKKEERSKTAKEATKFPGWKEGKDLDKYSYSDRFVQKLVKHSKQKTLIKRQPKVQFKPSEALLAEAAKVDELLNKLIVRSEETERSTKIELSKSVKADKNVETKQEQPQDAEKLIAEKADNMKEQSANEKST